MDFARNCEQLVHYENRSKKLTETFKMRQLRVDTTPQPLSHRQFSGHRARRGGPAKRKMCSESRKSSLPAPCAPASPISALAPRQQSNKIAAFHAKPHPDTVAPSSNVDKRQKIRDRLLDALTCGPDASDSSLLSPGFSPGVSFERFGGFSSSMPFRENSIISTATENIDKSSRSESGNNKVVVESMAEVGNNSSDVQSQAPSLQRGLERTTASEVKLDHSAPEEQEKMDGKESSLHPFAPRLSTKEVDECEKLETEPRSPDGIAKSIEAEIFTSFGGKKYKEKARTLVYNLKSNSELRGNVVGGHVTPTQLCNLNTDELAQRDLSNWRIGRAKKSGEHMVMESTDINVVVKHTHKGEVMVDLEKASHGDVL